jgi:hypothetical protein
MQDDDSYTKLFGQPVVVVPPVVVPSNARKVANCLYLACRTRPDPNSALYTYLMVGDNVVVNSTVTLPTGQVWANITITAIPFSITHPLVTIAGSAWVNAYYLK